jgi:hypothetical protein
MANPQCWAMLPSARRCEVDALPGRHFCEEHGIGSGPHPCNIWRAPEAEMPPDLVAAIRQQLPAGTFPDPAPNPPASRISTLPSAAVPTAAPAAPLTAGSTHLGAAAATVNPSAYAEPNPIEPPCPSVSPSLGGSSDPKTEEPLPAPRCQHTKTNGEPCRAYAVKESPFCLAHDPAHQEQLAAARSKGGSAPRRRLRRYPRILDHLHVAELLSELFIDALNDPERFDTRRLQAMNQFARTLLKAVGTPPTFYVHPDRREPPANVGHLLRLYPPSSPEVEALLQVEPPPDLEARWPDLESLDAEKVEELGGLHLGDAEAWGDWLEFLLPQEATSPSAPPSTPGEAEPRPPRSATTQEPSPTGTPSGSEPAPPHPAAASAAAATSEAVPEEDRNRPRTGPSPLFLAPDLPSPGTEPERSDARGGGDGEPLPSPSAVDGEGPGVRFGNRSRTGLPATEESSGPHNVLSGTSLLTDLAHAPP